MEEEEEEEEEKKEEEMEEKKKPHQVTVHEVWNLNNIRNRARNVD